MGPLLTHLQLRAASTVLALAMTLAGGVAGCAMRAGHETVQRPAVIAVVPLEDGTRGGGLHWLGLALQDALTWQFRRVPDAAVVDLHDLVQVGGPPARLAGLAPASLAPIVQPLGVTIVLAGRYEGEPDRLTVELAGIDVERRAVVARRRFETSLAEAPRAVRVAAAEVGAALGLAAPMGHDLVRRRPPTLSALVASARGIAAAAAASGGGAASLDTATAALREATAADPKFAEAWFRLGEVLVRASRYEEARAALARTLELARETDDGTTKIAASLATGETFLRQGRSIDAEPYFTDSLALARRQRDLRGEAEALHGIGNVHHQQGDYEAARSWIEQALAAWRRLANRRGEARVLNHLGVLGIIAGRYDAARRDLEATVAVARALGDRDHERIGLNNLGMIALRRGAYRDADAVFTGVLDLARASGNGWAEANTLENLGLVAMGKGAYDTAERYFAEGLERAEALGAGLLEVNLLEALGTIELVRRRYGEAERRYEAALTRARGLRIRAVEGRVLLALGQVLEARGAPAESERHYDRALALARQSGVVRLEGYVLESLGTLEITRGRYAEALARFTAADGVARTIGLAELEWRARYGMGRVAEALRHDADAADRYRAAVGVIAQLAEQFAATDERRTFLANKLEPYDALARVLLRLHHREPRGGHAREAWAVLEAKKGRLVAEALRGSGTEIDDMTVRGELVVVQAQRERADAVGRMLIAERSKSADARGAGKIRALDETLAAEKETYLGLATQFLGRYPEYKSLFVDQQTVDVNDLASFSEEIPEGTVAVQYYAAPDRLWVFVVTQGVHRVKTRAVGREELFGLVRDYRDYLMQAAHQRLPWADDRSGALKDITRVLSAHLLGPIEEELGTYRDVVFMPNDLLFTLPLHALMRLDSDGQARFLAETHTVSYLTRRHLGDLTRPSAPADGRPLLAMANPDGSLPGATLEVEAIKAIRQRSVLALAGPNATKAEFKRLARDYPDLHLATHGVLDRRDPGHSYLRMAGRDAETQRLGVREISALRLRNALAILSACETALNEEVEGAALITLAGAFSQAGARSIVASLWPVSDTATRDLMVGFHMALAANGRADALRQAQRALIANPATAHPFYWAAFILIGQR